MKRTGLPPALLFLTIFSHNAAYGDISTGLLNYWDFEGNFKDTAGIYPGNSSTKADDGTPSSVTVASGGPLGQYGDFAHGQLSMPNSGDVIMAGRSLSISAWFKVTAFDSGWQALIAHGEGSDYRVARYADGTVMAYAGGSPDIPNGNIGPAANDSQWHHVVAISEAGVSTRIWVDGVLIATGSAPTITNNGSTQMLIGGNPDAGGRNWYGGIDDVAMWSRPLTDAEIGSIYTSGRAGTPLKGLLPNPDSDGDGLPDLWETANGLNPNSADGDDGATGDPDHDGLTNQQEYTLSTKPNVADTDGDGLSDGAEVNTHHTNPLAVDTDGDGLSDGAEVNTYHSNPLVTDTDGDGVADGYEVAEGTDPATVSSGFNFGLMAYWPMDSDYNSSVGGITATANGSSAIAMVPGKFGNAIQLNGVDQFLQADGDENKFDFVGQSMTVSAWFTADVIDKDWQCLIAKGDASENWRLHRRGGDLPAELSFCGGSADVPRHNVPLSVGTGLYHHVVAVSERNVGVRLYIDGAMVSSAGVPNFLDSPNPMKIGANPDTSPPRFWNGKVDDVAIWRRALTEAEIAQLWNGGTGNSVQSLLVPASSFEITNVNFDKATSQWSLSWNSQPGKTYTLRYSTDLLNFGNDINDSIPSGGATTSFGPFPHPIPASGTRLFFRVLEN